MYHSNNILVKLVVMTKLLLWIKNNLDSKIMNKVKIININIK